MKEQILREMIRTRIKSSLNESPEGATARVGTTLDRVEKMAGVKMLKKALGQGSPQQQAAGLLKVVQSISGNNPTTAKALARMLMKGGIGAEDPVSEDQYTAGVDDGEAGESLEEYTAGVDDGNAAESLEEFTAGVDDKRAGDAVPYPKKDK